MIDRNSPISLYYQIATDLRQRIARGEWLLGEKIPAEPGLAAEYHVSRMTLRQALAYLENEGLLLRQRGIGTLVNGVPQQVSATTFVPLSFSRQIRELGFSPQIEILRKEIIQAGSGTEAGIMTHYAQGETWVCFERLFLLENIPLAISVSYIPERLCPGITHTNLVSESLTTTLEKTYGLFAARVDQRLQSTQANEEQAKLLKIEPRAALMEISTSSYLPNDDQLEFAVTRCVGERLSTHIQVTKENGIYTTRLEYVMTINPPPSASMENSSF